MNTIIFRLASGCLGLGALSIHAADVSVGIAGEIRPGVYGRINIGSNPPPPVFYPQPLVIVQQPRSVPVTPVYLHVPPGHAKHWSKHCKKYNACSQPVYFVKSAEYEPGYDGKKEKKKKKEKRDD